MPTGDHARPIVQNLRAYIDDRFERIDESAMEVIKAAIPNDKNYYRQCLIPLLTVLECYLRVSGQVLNLDQIRSPAFGTLCLRFLGALYSARFSGHTANRKYSFAKVLVDLVPKLNPRASRELGASLKLSTLGPSDLLLSHIKEFDVAALDEEQVWLCRRWPAVDKKGRDQWLDLLPVYGKLGKDFVSRLHDVCVSYVHGRVGAIPCIGSLCEFIATYDELKTPKDFENSLFVTRFFRAFLVFHFKARYERGTLVTTLLNEWRSQFAHFAIEYLVGSGLFAEPLGAFPMPERGRVEFHRKRTPRTPDPLAKLLTPIPIEVSDDEALELLFGSLRDDFDLIVAWARHDCENLWGRYERRVAIAPFGAPRTIGITTINNGARRLVDPLNPDWVANIAATFVHHGFMPGTEKRVTLLYGGGLEDVAYELALPTNGALLPHCALLVATHPQITPSFLETLELFDRHGKMVGLVETDAGTYLIGRKARRGAVLAQQRILLNDETKRIVEQLIVLTEPLRDFLRERSHDDWRFLLLSCGRSFGVPHREKTLATYTSMSRKILETAAAFESVCDLSFEERIARARRFSLTSLRATAAVLVYLETRSVEKMALALGHDKYHPGLLAHYLPAPLRAFFQERWIRIFQAGVIVEAMKDSSYLLEASSFKTIAELHMFLSRHALREIPVIESAGSTELQKPESEVLFGVSPEILQVLLSLHAAVEMASGRIHAKARYWAGIAARLSDYLASEQHFRDDLRYFLQRARKELTPELYLELIRA
ncbi:MAG: hypothetical protein JNM76_10130 [Betaproteobacteria bacterium]|nr:hypothetical protein [Betaproteobacteria bacterium]